MSFDPSPFSEMETPRVSDGSEVIDLQSEYFAVGGGDIRIAQLFEEARKQGYEVQEPVYRCRPEHEGTTFRPPGFETQE